MNSLVAVIAASHVPGHTMNRDVVPRQQLLEVDRAWPTLRHELSQARPDLVVAVSNDHFRNFVSLRAPFCVGTSDVHAMPSPDRATALKLPTINVSGNASFAEHLLDTADALGFPLAYSEELIFSDEISIPQRFLDPDNKFSWLPTITNCLDRKRPNPRTFFRLGEVIALAVERDHPPRRVALVVTGGLSHDPLGPNWCLIDERFDRRFLELLATGATDTLFSEYTRESILTPGQGGTPEILNWFVGLGAVGAGARAKIHRYEPIPEFATGVGYASWPIADHGRRQMARLFAAAEPTR
jgi:protocatechuate 4,5-dioxygenase beta chain